MELQSVMEIKHDFFNDFRIVHKVKYRLKYNLFPALKLKK